MTLKKLITEQERDYFGTLNPHDYAKFFKRLRKTVYPQKIKCRICGEYGTDPRYSERPHYHAIIFGLSALRKQKYLTSYLRACGAYYFMTPDIKLK